MLGKNFVKYCKIWHKTKKTKSFPDKVVANAVQYYLVKESHENPENIGFVSKC